MITWSIEAFGSKSKLGKIPAFLSCWLSTLAITPGTIAVIALTSSEYLTKSIFGECTLSRVTTVPISAVIISTLLVLHFPYHVLCEMLCCFFILFHFINNSIMCSHQLLQR